MSPTALEDIEELGGSAITWEAGGNFKEERVALRPRKPHVVDRNGVAGVESFVPGAHLIYVRTWGCAHNSSDGEYMSGLLAARGHRLTDERDEADLWLLNSCTVKNPAEDHFRNMVEEGLIRGKKVVAAGCVSQGKPSSDYLKGLSIIGVKQIDRVVEVVEETLQGNSVRLLGGTRKDPGVPLDMPKVRRNPLIEILAINSGCLNRCTYCKTKFARGDLVSYPPDQIVARAKQSFAEGVVEIWLTSEDTGAYGRDIDTTLPELLWQLVDVIPDGCRLRLGMTNPPYMMDHLDEIARVLVHPRVYAFLHVPVQSGSNAVLRDMRREYNVDDFSRVVSILRRKVPGISIATDIICGFPTETEEDFEETLALCRKYNFPTLFINQFFPRPGTPAARMKRLPTQEVKRRSRLLSQFFQSYSPFDNRVGQKYTVLVTETAHDDKHYVGHNQFYEQVLVPRDVSLMGKLVDVEIVSTCKFSMTGKPVNTSVPQRPTAVGPLRKGQVSGMRRRSKPVANAVSWWYRLSVLVLALAIGIRIIQVVYMQFFSHSGSRKDSVDTEGGLQHGGTQAFSAGENIF